MTVNILKRFNMTPKMTLTVALAFFGLFAAVNGIVVLVWQQGIEITGDNNVVVIPKVFEEVQPADIACNAERSVRSSSPQGTFYQAALGQYTVAWTDSLDIGDKVVVTDGEKVAWLDADDRTTTCLKKKAVPARSGN